jgi:dihydroorotate dehydrogenase
MKRLIIGAPFGGWVTHPLATSTIGTYTFRKRAGRLKRLWRYLSTVWYYPRAQAWVSRLQLPSPGICSISPGATDVTDKIISIRAEGVESWGLLAAYAALPCPLAVELNLSCPNTDALSIQSAVEAASDVMSGTSYAHTNQIIAKLGPVRPMEYAARLYDVGVRRFHLCNAMTTPGGSLSGKPLQAFSLWAVEEARKRWGDDVEIIGGGGVTCAADARVFLKAGADRVSVASACFNPFGRSRRLDDIARAIEEFGMP